MFLKSLTLRGFKSFADKTLLEFEPGITVIVGPNGSGKSNIVDAFAWVFGTHSAKSLRGGTMSDVIFAGAPGKPALGRAEVEITIDNSSGALPIEFSEVTISRSMFSSGEAEYRINNVPCRLLDVQELLSDTGLGRENHTIVGQGQLDAVLNAKPEERRAFIEEAAGILKHRRRKERALRKLTQMEQHLERLNDIVRELRRNLRPLERQAEAAAKHAELSEQLKAVRVDRALRELAVLDGRWNHEAGEQTRSDERFAVLESDLATARSRESELDQALTALAPAAREAGQTHFRLANLVERYRGLTGRIEERRAGLLEAVEEPVAGRDPEELRVRARDERVVLEELEAERSGARGALEQTEEQRREAERARRAHEQAAAAEARRRAEAREHRLRWEGEVSALRSSLAQAAGEEGRLASQVAGVESRKAELERDVETVTRDIQRLDSDAAVLADQLASAETVLERKQEAQKTAALRERELERQRASLEARADALRAASQEATEGSAALLAAAEKGELQGVVGALADQVSVAEPSLAKAVAAALGPLGDALVVRSRATAREAVGFVRSRQSGRVLLLVGEGAHAPAEDSEALGELAMLGARPVADVLRAEPGLHAALRRALSGVYVVDADNDAWAAVCKVAERHPDLVFVSVDGDVAGPRGYAGGSATTNSAVLSKAAAEQAEARLAEVSDELLRAHRQLADADRELEAAKREYDAATAAMQESDGQLTAAAERLKRLRKELETCATELGVLHGQQADLAREIAQQRERLNELESRGVEAVPEPESDAPDLEAERLDDVLADAREREVQARLAVSAVEQRAGEVARRIESYEREAAEVERQLEERERRRVARLAAIERCGELLVIAGLALARSEQSLGLAEAERDRLDEARAAQQREIGVVRARIRELEDEVGVLREARHAEDLRRQELRHAIDAVAARLAEDYQIDAVAALAERRESDPASLEPDEERDAALAELEDKLLKKVGLLGTVNPLALQEFTAMQERHEFLETQIEDLRQSKRDLMKVVEAVDERIKEVFAAAFADVAREFERIFPRMFPGGEGKLVLTDPDNMLESGVEVEARPPGKRVKRLSLLSGGERSLTALAVLFAIFSARPSPFYVLDEVEAALDDVNLQRFLDVVKDFKHASQMLIVTHQKRTMEVADCLYGITMQGNGVSKTISQKVGQPA